MSNNEDDQYAFLNDEVPEEVAEQAPEPEPEKVEIAPEPPAPVVPTTTEPEATHVPLAALKAEREKRQAHERDLADARRQLAQFQQQQQQQAEPPPNFYEAPEQFVQQALGQQAQFFTQRMFAALEEQARDTFADYDEVLGELAEQVQTNPALRDQVFNSPNPANAAYRLGKQMREMKAMQDPAAYRAKVEAEVRASIAKEATDAAAAKSAQAAAIPPDLSAARSSRDQEVLEDDSLDSILASRKKR